MPSRNAVSFFVKFFSLMLVVICLTWPKVWAAMDPQLTNAEQLMRSSKIDEGKRLVTDYITNHENVTGYMQVGSLYARLKRWPDAVHYLQIATTRDEKNALAWYELGLAQHQSHQTDEAIVSLRKSITISSKTEKSIMALGEILEFSDDRFDARNNYLTGVKKLGNKAPLRGKLCWLFFADAFWAEAIKECGEAHRLDASDVVSWTLLAHAQYEQQLRSTAFETFHKILAQFPKSALTYRARGLIYLEEKSYEQAAADLGKAFGFDPTDDEAAIGLARCLFEMGRYDQALYLYTEACKLDRTYRFEFLAKQRDLLRKNKDAVAAEYQDAVDKF